MNDSPRRLTAILWNRTTRLPLLELYELALYPPHGLMRIDGWKLKGLRLPFVRVANDN